MFDARWKESEKKIARRAFDAALQREVRALMVEFKARAAAAADPADLWAIEEDLGRARRDIDARFDYRYSQLHLVFGRLLREGRIEERELAGLSDDKLEAIRRIAGQ